MVSSSFDVFLLCFRPCNLRKPGSLHRTRARSIISRTVSSIVEHGSSLEALTCQWSFTFHKPFQPTRLVRTKRQNVHDRGDNCDTKCCAMSSQQKIENKDGCFWRCGRPFFVLKNGRSAFGQTRLSRNLGYFNVFRIVRPAGVTIARY